MNEWQIWEVSVGPEDRFIGRLKESNRDKDVILAHYEKLRQSDATEHAWVVLSPQGLVVFACSK